MERYRIIDVIGTGTYGTVMRAIEKKTKRIVAIKKMKRSFRLWKECLENREVQALIRLKGHPNIIELLEVIRENETLYLVFEFMEENLCSFMRKYNGILSETKIRNIMYQCLQGCDYLHQRHYIHRDIKPENILIDREHVKIADFGLVREITKGPPFTEYVSTRWYRAPELLFHNSNYSQAVDIWALGAIMAELFLGYPLFPGRTEIEQILQITKVLGTPSQWPATFHVPQDVLFKFPHMPRKQFSELIPHASYVALDLLERLLCFDPQQRITASQALQHPFFDILPITNYSTTSALTSSMTTFF